MVTAVKDGSDGVVSVIRGFGAGNEGKSAVKTLGKKQLFRVNCICKWLDTQIRDSQKGHKYITWTEWIGDGQIGFKAVFLRGRGRERNFTSYYQSLINKPPLTVKNIPYRFSIDFVCLQTSPFATVIINAVTRKKNFSK